MYNYYRRGHLSEEEYRKIQEKKIAERAEELQRKKLYALKYKTWKYWSKKPVPIKHMSVSHLENAIRICKDNPDVPRYDGFLPLLEARLSELIDQQEHSKNQIQ